MRSLVLSAHRMSKMYLNTRAGKDAKVLAQTFQPWSQISVATAEPFDIN